MVGMGVGGGLGKGADFSKEQGLLPDAENPE